MKSIHNIGNQLASIPLIADDIIEFHAARLILLFKLCGIEGSIDGLTKMAKLDFFVRYPQFFDVACRVLEKNIKPSKHNNIETRMIRYHYGPWDRRYYHILSYLKSKRILHIEKIGNTFKLSLTLLGDKIANELSLDDHYKELRDHMLKVKYILGDKKGSELKKFIYEVFDTEVGQKNLHEVIE